MKSVAKEMVSKGILAADESKRTMNKRLAAVGLEGTEENLLFWRTAWRTAILSMPTLSNYVSGVILNEETVIQHITPLDGYPSFPQYLNEIGVIPGVKVDLGAKEVPLFDGQTITEGLDGLKNRLEIFRNFGCRFTKWRAVIQANSKNEISPIIVVANAHALARFASISQATDMVPIVEPEVIIDNDWDIERVGAVTMNAIKTTMDQLAAFKVDLEAIVLKPNMVMAGYKNVEQSDPSEVARETLKVLNISVPTKIPGVAFLSGGQPDKASVENLRAINASLMDRPWRTTFSYGRGLQSEAMKVWSKNPQLSLDTASEEVFVHRLKEVYQASLGE